MKEKKIRKNPLKLGIETYGDEDREECFRKAFAPYFENRENSKYALRKK